MVAYRGTTLREFDLDAALARRPAVILVDELAHTNAPGSRHAKRWQDVLELLDAGINVYTTLNVQHVESLNDIVAKITGVIVRETVPDSVLERADQIELVDLPPDELLQRLQEGKVYLPEQAQAAVQNFFRKGNLMALRELALRRTAERVDAEMQAYMRDHAVARTWPVSERILVCVSPSPLSAQLVRAGRRLATRMGAQWIVAYVETPASVRLPQAARDRVVETLRLAEQLGAETVTLSGRHDERGDPRVCAGPERQQDRHRQARPVPVAADRARLRRGRAGPGQRGDRHLRRERRPQDRAHEGAADPAAARSTGGNTPWPSARWACRPASPGSCSPTSGCRT